MAALLAAVVLTLGGCGISSAAESPPPSASASESTGTYETLDATTVHTVAVTVDEASLKDMIQNYLDTGDKSWITGSVTIDGETFENVGIKLKGNSSLRSITVDTPAQELPLRIRLDKYVDDQQFMGVSDFTVRSNSSETSMNEAVALDLLNEAGLASTQAIATRFSVNGGEETLRLTVQNLDETWVEQNFQDAGADSVLYKSDAQGSWTWLGQDGDYSSSFDVEAGPENYDPLIELLDLLNNGTAEEIAEKLPTMLDLDSFATYLAFQDVINNFDDIDGPGNNSYLFWDSETGVFTVVAWDHNLAFGGNGAGGAMPNSNDGQMREAPDGQMPEFDGQMPEFDGTMPDIDGGEDGGRGMSRSNPLVDAFKANSQWEALYEAELAELESSLIDGGALDSSVAAWIDTLQSGASDLVSSDVITSEAESIVNSGKNTDSGE